MTKYVKVNDVNLKGFHNYHQRPTPIIRNTRNVLITTLAIAIVPLMGRASNAQIKPLEYHKPTPPYKPQLIVKSPAQDFLDALKHKADVARHKTVVALRKARQKAALALEKQRAIEKAQADAHANVPVLAKPVYQTSGCTTYHSTGALEQLIMHESGGNTCATNAGGCFGLLQACPGQPLRDACGGNPTCQIAWFQANKTGGRSWETIWAEWQIKGWW